MGSEIVSEAAASAAGRGLRTARVGASDMPIPSSRYLESQVLPSKERITEAILGLLRPV